MRKSMTALFAVVVVGVLAGAVFAADKKDKKDEKPAAAATEKKAAGEAAETIVMEKTGKLAPVKFSHAKHAELVGGCAACHEGDAATFKKERSADGMKMADMYAGKGCGSCHDGKKEFGGKKVFAAKGACGKCHKK